MIILATAPNKYPFLTNKTPPLGLGYICSYLKSKEIESIIFDFDAFPISLQKAVDLILSKKPEIVGFTCYSQNYFIVRKFCELIKKRNPEVLTVIGGPAPTFAFDDILNDSPYIDICVLREGEKTLEEIYNNINEPIDKFLEIKGIAFKYNEKIIVTPKRPLISKLDDIPSPYLNEVFDLRYYSLANISTSRGCPMKCIFCVCGAMFGSVRFHSPERVLDEIDYIYNLNEKLHWSKGQFLFNFTDDTFTYSEKHVNAIIEGLENRNYKMSWAAATRITHINKELLIRMKNVGLKMINFGLESADPYILKVMKKIAPNNESLEPEIKFLEKVKEIMSFSKKIGIQAVVNYIIGHPFETPERAKTTVKFCNELMNKFGVEYIPNILIPFKGKDVFNNAELYNIEMEKDPELLLPYSMKKYSAMEIDDLIEIFPYNHRFFVYDELYNRSLIHFKKLNPKNCYKSNIKFKKFMNEKLLKGYKRIVVIN